MTSATVSTKGILNPDAGRRAFELVRHPPARDLADVIERHWVVRWDLRGRGPFVQQTLPHPAVNLVVELDQALVHGIGTRRSSKQLEQAGWAVGTKFRPGGFAGFVDFPSDRLNDRSITLVDAFGPDGLRLTRDVYDVDDPGGRIAVIEAFLRERRPAPDPVAKLVTDVIAWMLTAPPRTRVKDVARAHGVSTRTLQRSFRTHVGVSPKWVLKRYRLHDAAERIAAGEVDDWPRLASELGYFDQAHFIGDFRALVGMTPAGYAAACRAARAAPAQNFDDGTSVAA